MLLGIAIVLLLGSCSSMGTAYDLRSSGRDLNGRVVDRDADGPSLEVKYRIGEETFTRRFDVDVLTFRSHPKRSRVPLLYLPSDPGGAVIANDPSLSGSKAILLLLPALAFGVVGLILTIMQPGAGNIFKRSGSSLTGESDDLGDGQDVPGDESDEGPAFVGGRPV